MNQPSLFAQLSMANRLELALDPEFITRDEFTTMTVPLSEKPQKHDGVYALCGRDLSSSPYAVRCTIEEPDSGVNVTFHAAAPGLKVRRNVQCYEEDDEYYAAGDVLTLKIHGDSTIATEMMRELLDAKPGDEITLTQDMFEARYATLVKAGCDMTKSLQTTLSVKGEVIIQKDGETARFKGWHEEVSRLLENWDPIRGTVIDVKRKCNIRLDNNIYTYPWDMVNTRIKQIETKSAAKRQ